MKITTMTLGRMMSNCYIIEDENQAIIIDPGDEGPHIIHYLNTHHLTPLAICLTHGHFDHIGAVDDIVLHYNIPVYIHPLDEDMVYDKQKNLSHFSHPFCLSSKVTLVDEHIQIGKHDIVFKNLPGHSPGSSFLVFEDEKVIFSGDVLFKKSIGRCDFPGSSFVDMQKSLRYIHQIKTNYQVYPGHGEMTTIFDEQRDNPYL